MPKGRMSEESLEFLFQRDLISFKTPLNSRQLQVFDAEKDVEILFIRSKDVPIYVEQGAADLGIIGYDLMMEWNYKVFIPIKLPFGICRLSIAYPNGREEWKQRKNIKIATKYPRLTSEFFYRKGYNVEMIELYGSIEIAPSVGISDVIVDLVSTGQTLKVNHLVEGQTILNSHASLIVNPQRYFHKRQLINQAIDQLS